MMELITVFIIAIGLSFDSFAVSLGCGAVEQDIKFRRASKIAIILALFQGFFPVFGYYLGSTVHGYVESVDHWIAFALLVFIGLKMIIEGSKEKAGVETNNCFTNNRILTLAIGTSIDALAVGISFALIYEKIWFAALIIGLVTYIASMTAIRIGKFAGPRLGSRVEIIGGLLLIGIGVKILLEHTVLA
ncbi:MAG: manganese efflux pump MntP family protein [Bacteroidales bacterium]|nr:manganese efflux pump MntP family protein [Bacteroidales bacterium]